MKPTKNLNDQQLSQALKQALKHKAYKSDYDLAIDLQSSDKFDINAYEAVLNSSNIASTNQASVCRNFVDYYDEIHTSFEEDKNDSRIIRRVTILKKRNKGTPVTLNQLSAQISQLASNCATKADIRRLESRINVVDGKVNVLTTRVNKIDKRLTKLEKEVKVIKTDVKNLKVDLAQTKKKNNLK